MADNPQFASTYDQQAWERHFAAFLNGAGAKHVPLKAATEIKMTLSFDEACSLIDEYDALKVRRATASTPRR